MFKIAYCAGHHLGNSKGIPTSMGLGEVREWTLNDRVADYFAEAAQQYEDVALLRTDDPTGQTLIDIPERCAAANTWGADLYLDIHHNGGINGGSGGGVVAFSYPGSAKGKAYREAIYAAVIASGGLKGNRSEPQQEKAFDSLRYSNMPGVLMEYGFMDSTTDAPVIVTDAYAKAVAYGTMAGIAKVEGLSRKPVRKAAAVSVWELRQGSSGEDVRALQILLSGYGFKCSADGIFGANTDKQVRAYQKSGSLTVDGVVGPRTWAKLLGL